MTNEFNFHELKASERLPSPSGTALAIVKLVQQDNATLQQVAQLVKIDPALSGRILRFVNSAAFGAQRPIANIQDAVMMMGMQAARNFALSLSLIGNNSSGNCSGFDYAAYWSHSLAMAVAITAITTRERTVPLQNHLHLDCSRRLVALRLQPLGPKPMANVLPRRRMSSFLLWRESILPSIIKG